MSEDNILKDRIKRKIEPDMCVVQQTTPVIYFGDYDSARACTISLNPSNLEFVDKSKKLLELDKERLCSREKLKKTDNDELTDEDAEKVLKYCKNYFKYRPYKSWFDPFNKFVEHYEEYSYYKGTCVHLDLVQWATDPTWKDIPTFIKQKHLDNDLPILKHLLKKNFEVMFLNGITVVENVRAYLNIKLEPKTIPFTETQKVTIYYGKYNNIKVVGWNLYLQSAACAGKEKRLCDLIKSLAPWKLP
ncbi:MAG: hypothetical protein LBC75_12215 [Fibromonadaceae bacterium]|jgi:hypothetical protein|nr:hypothetical protein [Fibromonadaceae bacterium]